MWNFRRAFFLIYWVLLASRWPSVSAEVPPTTLHTHSVKKLADHSKLSMIWSGALSLHFEIPELGLTYQRALEDAKRLKLTHVALIAQATMSNIHSNEVKLIGTHVTPISKVRHVAKLAKDLGLQVIIFPILWIEERNEGEWRGTLAPQDLDQWWNSYELWLGALAEVAEEYQATHLSIGSELSSLEKYEGRWRALIRRIRVTFHGSLTYSANWDHYDQVRFWDALDIVGITGYYPLADEEVAQNPPTLESMSERWRWVRLMLVEWIETLTHPHQLMITELGYPSQYGGVTRPWHYTQSKEIDLENQSLAFAAFSRAWIGEPHLIGVNFWNLWGLGGVQDTWYTLKGKPAFEEVRKLIETMRQNSLKPMLNHDLKSIK